MSERVKLAVTGLSQAGKTVFISSLLHNLTSYLNNPDAMKMLTVIKDDRLKDIKIIYDAHPTIPLFEFRSHASKLLSNPPSWPSGTEDLSAIQIEISYIPKNQNRFIGIGLDKLKIGRERSLFLDIIDYPGEWLLDLPMLDMTFEDWSKEILTRCESEPRASLALEWRKTAGSRSPSESADYGFMAECAKQYTSFLEKCKSERHLRLLQPGHFLRPGRFRNAPMMHFCPLEGLPEKRKAGTLHAAMATNFDRFKKEVVQKFVDEHYSQFDRQIVLVDVLKALNDGQDAFTDSKAALSLVLQAFRNNGDGWVSRLTGRNLKKVLIAATKADHITRTDHLNLKSLTEKMMTPGVFKTEASPKIMVMTLASVRCTTFTTGDLNGQPIELLTGALVGEGNVEARFPGNIPAEEPIPWDKLKYRYEDYRPPNLVGGVANPIPHWRLDEALEFLIGEKLS